MARDLKAYPIDPYHAARAANLRDAVMPKVMCKTCRHFVGLKAHCERFKVLMSQSKVCDEWKRRPNA